MAEIDADGQRVHRYFEGEGAERLARGYVAAFRAQTKERSLATAVTEYLEHLRRFGGAKRRPLKDRSLRIVRSKLEGLLQLVDAEARKANRGARRPVDLVIQDKPLRALTPNLAQQLYTDRTKATKSDGEPISADTHRSELIYAHAFGGWCVEQGYLRDNPFSRVLPEGELSRGKAQLGIDEARVFIRGAYSDGGLKGYAAAGILTLGLRSNELLERRVRDLDDGGRVLDVYDTKTKAGERKVVVPPVLRSALLELCRGLPADAYIFGTQTDGTLLKYVHELCERLGVTDVCTHGLRGTHVSLTVAVQQDIERTSRGVGHETTGVTRSHYLAAGVEQSARAKLMEEILLRDDDTAAREAAIAAAEKEAREATARLAALRGAVTLPLGTTARVPYPTTPKDDATN